MRALTEEQGYRLALARSAAIDALDAVALQRERIREREDDAPFAVAGSRQEIDVAFMLLALRWLREACQLIAELTEQEALAAAVRAFDHQLPQARDLRDVREHIRDYIKGAGKLQSETTAPERIVPVSSLGKRTWCGHDELSHFTWAGKELRLDDALPVAEALFGAMRDAIAPHVTEHGIRVQGTPPSGAETSAG